MTHQYTEAQCRDCRHKLANQHLHAGQRPRSISVAFVIRATASQLNIMCDIVSAIRYVGRLQIHVRSFILFVSLCLLSMQMSELHLHIDTSGKPARLHGAHLQHDVSSAHSHNAEIDVPLLEQLGATWSKLLPLILFCAILLVVRGWLQQRIWIPPTQVGTLYRQGYWRPPLRAPPQTH